MNNKEILDNNKELINQNPNAVHKSICITSCESEKVVTTCDAEYRSIADIERIVELESQVEFQIKELQLLAQACNRYKNTLFKARELMKDE